MRHILIIEYEYACMYVNSIALGAVIERCTSDTPPAHFAQPRTSHSLPPNTPVSSQRAIPASVLQKWLQGDRKYVEATIQAGQSLLGAFLRLLPDDYLKHAPVRTYFRVTNGTIMLLKVVPTLSAMKFRWS